MKKVKLTQLADIINDIFKQEQNISSDNLLRV